MGAAPIPISALRTRLAAPVMLANIATSIPYRQYCFAYDSRSTQVTIPRRDRLLTTPDIALFGRNDVEISQCSALQAPGRRVAEQLSAEAPCWPPAATRDSQSLRRWCCTSAPCWPWPPGSPQRWRKAQASPLRRTPQLRTWVSAAFSAPPGSALTRRRRAGRMVRQGGAQAAGGRQEAAHRLRALRRLRLGRRKLAPHGGPLAGRADADHGRSREPRLRRSAWRCAAD